ncbi:MAG: uracil phosphoribosyltransferase [Flavobacteriaceae bacterium]|nr:uracil phosphoribosyltransferase [Flavobacteriaceae bacterium]
MNCINLGEENSIFNTFISEIRNIETQQDSMRFRRNVERMGEIFAYEISKQLSYQNTAITTPLGTANIPLSTDKIVLATILRAGLPLHQGFLNYFDGAENGFIGAYRKTASDHSFTIETDYLACPNVDGKTVILSDPMLASGESILVALNVLKKRGTAKHIHIAILIASQVGVNYVLNNLPDNATLWVGAIDNELNANAYIVPGLGDAGDLAFGEKI